jgi:hypothetical protein
MATTNYRKEAMNDRYTLEQIQGMPTIHQGQYANLKVETGKERGHHLDGDEKVWLSRFTVEDGAPYDNQVTVERLVNGCWVTVDEYEAAR